MRIYYRDTQFDFGKYNGKTLDSIRRVDPDYLEWCRNNIKAEFRSSQWSPIAKRLNEFHQAQLPQKEVLTKKEKRELRKKNRVERQAKINKQWAKK